jgi:hypothetical protein
MQAAIDHLELLQRDMLLVPVVLVQHLGRVALGDKPGKIAPEQNDGQDQPRPKPPIALVQAVQ